MSTIKIPTFLNIPLHVELAGPDRRAGAFLIDWLIKGGILFVLVVLLDIPLFGRYWHLWFIFMIPLYFYTFLSEWLMGGQTIGKRLLGLRVVNEDGRRATVMQLAIRWVFLLPDAYVFYLLVFVHPGFSLLMLFGPLVAGVLIALLPQKQRLGDMAARTLVIREQKEKYSISDTIYGYMNFKENYEVAFPEVMRLSDRDMTIVKQLLEKSAEAYDPHLAYKLANHLKTILAIDTQLDDKTFLARLLADYNHLSVRERLAT